VVVFSPRLLASLFTALFFSCPSPFRASRGCGGHQSSVLSVLWPFMRFGQCRRFPLSGHVRRLSPLGPVFGGLYWVFLFSGQPILRLRFFVEATGRSLLVLFSWGAEMSIPSPMFTQSHLNQDWCSRCRQPSGPGPALLPCYGYLSSHHPIPSRISFLDLTRARLISKDKLT